MPPSSAAMELKVLISVLQSGNTLKNMLGQVTQLSQALNNLQAQAAKGSGGPPIPPIAPNLQAIPKSADDATKAIKSLEGAVNGVVRAAKFMAGGFLALQSVRFIKDLADVAARAQVLQTVLHVVATNAGITTEEIDRVDKSIQRLGITAESSRESLTQFMQARLDLSFAPKLARAAQDLAVISGKDSSQTFARLILNIQQLDALGLRWMGIIVDRAAAEEKYKQKIQDTTKVLNKREQQAALMDEVLFKAAQLEGAYSNAMNDVGKQITSLERLTKTYKQTLGESLLPAYSVIVAKISTMFEKLILLGNEFSNNKERAEGLAKAAESLVTVFTNLAIFVMEHLEGIITLVKWYLELKVALMFFRGAEAYLMWLIKAVDWVNKLRLAFKAWELGAVGFKVALQALGAASVVESAKMLEVAAAQTTIAATAGPAAVGVGAVGTAVEGTTLAVSGLATAWGIMAATLAIPVIGLIIYKVKEIVEANAGKSLLVRAGESRGEVPTEFGVKPRYLQFFDVWKKENPQLVEALKTDVELMKEFDKQIDEAMNTFKTAGIAEKLGAAKEELAALQVKRDQLLHPTVLPALPPEIGEIAAIDKQIEAATKKVVDLREEIKETFKYEPQAQSTKDIFKQFDLVEKLQRDLGKARDDFKTGKIERDALMVAEASLEVEKERLKVMQDGHAEALKRDTTLSESAKATDRAATNLKAESIALSDSADALTAARKQIFGEGITFTAEGATTSAFANALSGYTVLLDESKKLLDEKGEIPSQLAEQLKKGLEKLGEAAKLPLDLANFRKLLPQVREFEKAVPGVTAKVGEQLEVARLGVRQEALRPRQPIVAEKLEDVQRRFAPILEAEKQRIAKLKTQRAFELEESQRSYDQKLIGVEAYYQKRRQIIEDNAQTDADFQELQIAELEAKQAAAEDPKAKEAFGVQIEAIRGQQRAGQQQAELERQKLLNEQFAIMLKMMEDMKAAQLALAAAEGGSAEQLALLNYQMDQEIKNFKASAIAGWEELDRKKRLAGALEIERKERERLYQIKMQELDLDEAALDVKERERQLNAARIQARVAAGTMTDYGARVEENRSTRAAMEDNRRRREIEAARYQTNLAKFQKDAEENTRKETEGLITQAQAQQNLIKLEQDWAASAQQSESVMLGLDDAYLGLATSVQKYSKQIRETFTNELSNAITESIVDFQRAGDVWKNMAKAIEREIVGIFARRVAQSMVNNLMNIGMRMLGSFGGGGFTGAMPGSTTGLAGSGFGSGGGMGYTTAMAEGGLVSGPGTGTSDSIPAMVSAGEHIMPASKASRYLPLLEGIRLGTILPYALGGVVGLQSIAPGPLIPRRYASGGVVVSDGGAASVTPGASGGGNMVVSLHPEALNMTMREWLEHEVVRQQGRR